MSPADGALPALGASPAAGPSGRGASGVGASGVGSYAVDTRDGRVGQVMGHVGGYVQLRPAGGGREWDCPPDTAAPAPPDVVLRARVRAMNRESALIGTASLSPRPGRGSSG